jgi:metal-responsive CopG/Arc/MetJ family transcriptional regulator
MAKVMVSLPDDLLRRIDAEAANRGMTRSAVLRDYAEQVAADRAAVRAATMREIDREVTTGHGGDVVEVLKRSRPKR